GRHRGRRPTRWRTRPADQLRRRRPFRGHRTDARRPDPPGPGGQPPRNLASHRRRVALPAPEPGAGRGHRSTAGQPPAPPRPPRLAGAYTGSKRAVTAYADMLRAEYGTHIGVTTVHPGYVDTPIHNSSRANGASLDGLVPAERTQDTVMAVVRAAGAKHAPRDIASTALGTVGLHLTRHFPGTTEQVVALQMQLLLSEGTFADAEIAQGLHERHDTLTAQQNVSQEERKWPQRPP